MSTVSRQNLMAESAQLQAHINEFNSLYPGSLKGINAFCNLYNKKLRITGATQQHLRNRLNMVFILFY